MPNWVTNKVKITKRQNEILEYIKSEDSDFDFNKIIPMPETIFRGDIGRKEKEEYGDNNWYTWCVNNWGTKWNATEVSVVEGSATEDKIILFNTAWATPMPIMFALSKKFSDVEFEIAYADEDIGNNCGNITLLNGEVIFDEDILAGTPEARKFALGVIYGEDADLELLEKELIEY